MLPSRTSEKFTVAKLVLASAAAFAMSAGAMAAPDSSGIGSVGPFGKTSLMPKSGTKATGEVVFSRTKDGIEVKTTVANVSPGKHGLHIHEKGDCSAADASSAGAHFNPTSHQHGAVDPDVYHVGDLGNIDVAANGKGTSTVVIPSSKSRTFANWNDIIGKSVVLHAKQDDLKTQPAGASGDRIACGIISRIDVNASH